MHTTLGLAAALWCQLLPDPRRVANEGCKQKALALRGVRERLDKGFNDMALIGTIANLANIEGTEGNYQVARVHLKALDLLIRARQGYDELKDHVNVARVINWSDVQAAIGLNTMPILPMILTMDSISLPLTILTATETPSLAHLRVFEAGVDVTSVQDNFYLVRQAHYSLKSPEVPMQDFRVLINVVDHHLQTTLGGEDLTDQGRILVTTAHAFFYMTIRELAANHHLPRAILGRLRAQLQERAAAAWECGVDWDFFSQNLSMALALLNVSSSSQLNGILAGFLWHDKVPGVFLDQAGTMLFPPSLTNQDETLYMDRLG
ncbi:tachykinin family [Fusarium albosuccineum]|uniref:Tachykinin family n=1 Tax=Fusarium albosuccineum TaxID=1237068 RepID=A0A8H4KZH4_9HYPO|nr:tachykinin family [Fusarium albosuccineum]